MTKTLAVGLAIMAASMFLAAPASADPQYDSCAEGAADARVRACGDAWIQREDRRLNDAWREFISFLDGRERELALEEQRAWIRFKDQSCNFFTTGQYGTWGRDSNFPRCRAAVIASRVAELEALLGQLIEGGE